MNPFQSLRDYELFIYTLVQKFPLVQSSTLTLAQKGRLFAELTGTIFFSDGYRMTVYELLAWNDQLLIIDGYGYEVWKDSEKLYWYDSQPHPHIPQLASTDPHHKHVPPDIKHNRIPAPKLTFRAPNLPFLIEEIEAFLLSK